MDSDNLNNEFEQLDLNKASSGDEFGLNENPNCNLIVNYLPHDIDDQALRVR
jgi:hypothetical protein